MQTIDKPKTKKQQKAEERADAVARLRELLPPGTTVYTILRHRARSGMSRNISLIGPDNFDITYLVAVALDEKRANDGGIRVGGCGMDAGFSLVYNLSITLYQGRFECIGESCRSNDHSNGDRDRTPHQHTDGGYALRHAWL